MKIRYPYENRLWWRSSLLWFLIDFGIVEKGKNCDSFKAQQSWYNMDCINSSC